MEAQDLRPEVGVTEVTGRGLPVTFNQKPCNFYLLHMSYLKDSPTWYYFTLLSQIRKLRYSEVKQLMARKKWSQDSNPGNLTREPTMLVGFSKGWEWEYLKS